MGNKMEMTEKQWSIKYYHTYERWISYYASGYRKLYKSIYNQAQQMIIEVERDSLSNTHPKVLLCGTAAAETTLTFVRHVLKKNKLTEINIIDIHEYPIKLSKAKVMQDSSIDTERVVFLQANALALPFETGSIDLIETDLFLLFFSTEDKALLFREWSRLLSPKGVITTREFFPKGIISRISCSIKKKMLKAKGITTFRTSRLELESLAQQAGLETKFAPVKIGFLKLATLSHMVAWKPSDNS